MIILKKIHSFVIPVFSFIYLMFSHLYKELTLTIFECLVLLLTRNERSQSAINMPFGK